MKFSITILLVVISVSAFSQNKIDSSSFQEFTNSIQANLGKDVNKFSFKSTEGIEYSNHNLKGKITLINFWFEACATCIAEFNDLNLLYEKLNGNKNFQFISFTRDSRTAAIHVGKKYNLKFPIVCISEDECRELSFNSGFPLNMVIDENGKIIYVKAGGALEAELVKMQVEKLEMVIEKALLKAGSVSLHSSLEEFSVETPKTDSLQNVMNNMNHSIKPLIRTTINKSLMIP